MCATVATATDVRTPASAGVIPRNPPAPTVSCSDSITSNPPPMAANASVARKRRTNSPASTGTNRQTPSTL